MSLSGSSKEASKDRMKLQCLTDNPNKPCYVVRFNGVTVMLDCGLDVSTALNFMPIPLVQSTKLLQLQTFIPRDGAEFVEDGELRESGVQGRVLVDSIPEFGVPEMGLIDFSSVDVILISNFTTMLALPYITEETGFRGMIFATEPTVHFGRIFMEETICFLETSVMSKHGQKLGWKAIVQSLPAPLCHVHSPTSWRNIYSRQQMDSSIAKITFVGFSEQKDVFGLLTVSAASSGLCIGSSNWTITSGYEKIAYISGSSTLTTHPRLMDQNPLRNADCVILTALTQTPTFNPDPMIAEFCKTVVETTKTGGSVLVPCYPSGIVYDLIECLAGQMDLNNLTSIPMFFVSPVADASLAYSNIMAEWLSSAKQNRVYQPEEPFIHGHLVKSGRLKSFKNLYEENFSLEYRQPCVMFCGHPSLRFGDVIHFIELWGSNSNNTIVFTEPSFPYLDALAPFQPLNMKCVHCPIDTSLNFNQAKKLIKDLKPRMLAVPECYSTPPHHTPQRKDLVIETDIPRYTFSKHDCIQIPVDVRFEKINVDTKLVSNLVPVRVKSDVVVASVLGNLVVTNNKYVLEDIKSEASSSRKRKRMDHTPKWPLGTEQLFGQLDPKELMQKLGSQDIRKARMDEAVPERRIIHLEKEDVNISLEATQTHVKCKGAIESEGLRRKIRDILISCLHKF